MPDPSTYIHRPVAGGPPEAQPLWDFAEAGVFALPRCEDCDRWIQPGATNCPDCLGRNIAWRPAQTKGTIYSVVVFERDYHDAFTTPYAVCVVELADGPRIVGEVLGADPEAFSIGAAVDVEVTGEDRDPPVRFRLADRR